jgi:hypothetical protein
MKYPKYKFSQTKLIDGKYKDWLLKDVPDDYLKWATVNINDPWLASMFAHELTKRYPALKIKNPTIGKQFSKDYKNPLQSGTIKAKDRLG